jgi:hypothetical protein
LISASPIKPVGHKFPDISETKLYSDHNAKEAVHQDGKSIWFVAFCGPSSQSMSHVENLVKVVEENKDVHLYLFYGESDKNPTYDNIVAKNLPNVKIFSQSMEEAKFFGPHKIRSWENLIVVDRKGVVTSTGRVSGLEEIRKKVSEAEQGYSK